MAENSDHAVEVRFPVTFAGIVGFAVLALTVGYWFTVTKDRPERTVIFFATAVIAGGTIVAASYANKSLQKLTREQAERIIIEKKLASIRCGSRWNDPQLHHVRALLREINDGNHTTASEINAIINSPAKKENLLCLLNFLEELAFAVQNDVIDKRIAREQFKNVLNHTWSRLEDWIRDYRQKRSRPTLWEKAEALREEWNAI